MVFAIGGLITVFDSHNKTAKPIPNLYSIHSWIGLSTIIFFVLQWAFGFITFMFPKLNDGIRAKVLPLHKYFGAAIFILVCATALIGITEKAFFSLPR